MHPFQTVRLVSIAEFESAVRSTAKAKTHLKIWQDQQSILSFFERKKFKT